MCSRYSLTSPPEAVRSYFQTTNALQFPGRPDIRPTEPVLIVRSDAKGEREQVLVRWGLIPAWVKNSGELATLINARSETAAEKPSFRGPLRHRRCLVPTDGFYEWTGPTRSKTRHFVRTPPSQPSLMAFAGLWEHWLGADGSEIETMAILTVAANATVAPIHDRMPVIVAPGHFDRWLDCTPGSATGVLDLLRPAPDGLLEIATDSPRLLL
jgi:putative SOS response-associated peptidase YedK